MSDRMHGLPRMVRRRWPGLALPALVVIGLAGCSQRPPEAVSAVPIIAWQVQAADGAAGVRLPGDVHARYEMPLSFRIGGKLAARYVSPGDEVRKGAKLAELDPADVASARAAAEAAVKAAESRYAFAAQQLQRDEAQSRQNLISQLQLEQTRDAYAAALSGREQARQQLVQARDQQGYATLVADHDGTVTSMQADVGQVLAAGQAVFGFAWSGEREIHVDVPESRIGGIAPGQAVQVSLPALPGYAGQAHVREVASAADPQSRTYLVKLALDQPPPGVRLGMTAEASWNATGQASSAQRIPASALFHQGERPAVWVVRPADSTLELRPVTVLRYLERDVLLDGGLHVGERIVAQGVHTVSVGEKVTPIAPPHAEDAPQ